MNTEDKLKDPDDSDEVESMLTFGSPRERPSPHAKYSIYSAVRNDWLSEIKVERRNRRMALFGVAASIILAAAAAFYASQPFVNNGPALSAVLVRVTGNAINANETQIRANNYRGQSLHLKAGDMLTTHGDSRAAIAWNESGSLRIDNDSQINFLGNDRIRLNYGTVYYDSQSLTAGSSIPAPLTIETSLGTVSHVGTQFIAGLSKSGLRISVREGDVKFVGGLHDFTVKAGTTVGISADNTIEKENMMATDQHWKWTASIAPQRILDGQSTLDLIHWISRETGLKVKFETAAARNFAYNDRLVGMGRLDPLQALSTIPNVTNLRYEIDNETIIVSEKD